MPAGSSTTLVALISTDRRSDGAENSTGCPEAALPYIMAESAACDENNGGDDFRPRSRSQLLSILSHVRMKKKLDITVGSDKLDFYIRGLSHINIGTNVPWRTSGGSLQEFYCRRFVISM